MTLNAMMRITPTDPGVLVTEATAGATVYATRYMRQLLTKAIVAPVDDAALMSPVQRTIAGMTPSSLIASTTLTTSSAAATSPMSIGASSRASTIPDAKTPTRLMPCPSRLQPRPRDTRRPSSPDSGGDPAGVDSACDETVTTRPPRIERFVAEHDVVGSLSIARHVASVEPGHHRLPRRVPQGRTRRLILQQITDHRCERLTVAKGHQAPVAAVGDHVAKPRQVVRDDRYLASHRLQHRYRQPLTHGRQHEQVSGSEQQ